MPSPYFVYILKCSDDTYYVGHTEDLEERLKSHRAEKGSRHTASRLPVELVYCEPLPTRSEAMAREAQLKKWSRAKKEALIGSDHDALRALSRSREK
ncbi:GIY-YIG nuclease family protein [Haloferula sp.]|uniref:GIY-YIG nuclease family protein n=1 Tax=Haloferula sp. TaxID=2497595 RepID=UPI003C7436FF